MQTDVLIIGGGLSGLAAAVKLSEHGRNVMLVEASGKLGGRTYSFIHKPTGDVIDNGQHVLAGAYKLTLEYLGIIGTKKFLQQQEEPRVHFWSTERGFSTLSISQHLPRKVSFAKALLQFKGLSFASKFGLRRVENFLQHLHQQENAVSGLTVDEWLTSLKQSKESQENFWFPLAVSIMNETPGKASALLFARSLQATFFSDNARDATLLIPSVGQTELYVEQAEKLLRQNGVHVLLNSEAVSLVMNENTITGVTLKNGELIAPKVVLSCIPYFALSKIIGGLPLLKTMFDSVNKIKSSPIVSIYLWFDREIMLEDFIGVSGKNIQWVFNRNKITGQTGTRLQCLSVVISGAYVLADMTADELFNLCRIELEEIYPGAKKSNIIHSFVIKEKRATFSATPEIEAVRPGCETPVSNLLLAGDWTKTGLPATIEGAVQSGFLAAKIFFEKMAMFY